MSSNETRNPEAAPTTDALVATGNTATTSAAADLQNVQKNPSADGDMSIEATRISSIDISSRNRTERPQQQVDEDASQLLHSQVQQKQKQMQQQQRQLELQSQQMARIGLLLQQQHHQRQQQPSTFKEPDTGMLQHQQQRQQSATYTPDTGSRQADLATFPDHLLPTLSDVRHATRDTWLPAAAAVIIGYQTDTQTQQRTKGRQHIDIDWPNEYVHQLTSFLRS